MFELPEEALNAGNPLASQSSAVQLPFIAPTLYWYNGKPALADTEEIQDARRFGGWGSDALKLHEIADKLPPIPSNWRLFENLKNGEGKTYSAYLVRSVRVAPIARRWRFAEFKNSDGSVKKTSQVNVLSYLGYLDENHQVVAWHPVVLTASGYSVKFLDEALRQFGKDTADVRGETAARWFFAPIGTFGPKPIFKAITGKGGKTSEITPAAAGKPTDGWDSAAIEAAFVGKDLAAEILALTAQAQEWIHDWDKKAEKPPEDDLY